MLGRPNLGDKPIYQTSEPLPSYSPLLRGFLNGCGLRWNVIPTYPAFEYLSSICFIPFGRDHRTKHHQENTQ